MSKKILFARHGNTFAPGDKVVWIGRGSDLPLVEKGREQALMAATAMRRTGLIPDIIFCASLKRTSEFAKIITGYLDLPPPVIDERLDEIDYGRCEALSSDEINAFGSDVAQAMECWNENDQWPEAAGWITSPEDIINSLKSFCQSYLFDNSRKMPLIVSSNGILRFLPRLLAPDADQKSYKMRTGHLGLLENDGASSKIIKWDVGPESLSG